MAQETMVARETSINPINVLSGRSNRAQLSVNPNLSLSGKRVASWEGGVESFHNWRSNTNNAKDVRGSIMERAIEISQRARNARDIARINRAMNNQLGRVSTPRLSQATLQREFEDAQRRVRNRRR